MREVHFIGMNMMALLLILTACTSSEVEKVEIYHIGSFATLSGELVNILTKSHEVNQLQKIIDEAEEQSGIVDMAAPHYRVELDSRTYYLWIDGEYGTIINSKDTHTIYTLTENQVKILNRILTKN